MSFVSFGFLLLFVVFHSGVAISCPFGYNEITKGCYKVVNGTKKSWSDARDYCANETSMWSTNGTLLNVTTHLVALESNIEKNSLIYWMSAYGISDEFWIDGIVSSSIWDWSNQSITWFFEPEKRQITGNGTNYKIANMSNATGYIIADAVGPSALYFICEYQVRCNDSSTCQPNGICYLNLGENLCVCNPGFTGENCETDLDECLSSPCLHGGLCIDGVNNYTCNCSDILYTGRNCEIPKVDPTQSQRTSAFWAVLGIVTGLVVILTLSDLPWEDILVSIGCSNRCFSCFTKKNVDNTIVENDIHSSNSPANDQGAKKANYHVMNTVWDSDSMTNQTPRNPHYNGYRSPDQSKTPVNTQTQSLAATKQAHIDDKRVYAVDINQPIKPTPKTNDPADTMVSWTQQLQEQLRNKKPRETSASSTKQLVHSSSQNDD